MEKQKKAFDKSLAIVAICLVVILLTGFLTYAIKTDNGDIVVKEVVLSPYGVDLAGSIYIPKEALKTDEHGNFLNQYPAVMVNHGSTNSRSYLDNVSIELAKSGYVVMSYDAYGHGRSEYTYDRGFGKKPGPGSDASLLGGTDFLAYLRTLGFVDQTKIGMCGHSMGGESTARMAEKSAGFFTLQDILLNILYNDFGVSITAEQVAAQDADAVAEAALNDQEMGRYNEIKRIETEKYDTAVRDIVVFDSNVAGCAPKEVEVAGNTVMREVQANIMLLANLGGGLSKGSTRPDYFLTSKEGLELVSQDTSLDRDVWYSLNLSGTAEKLASTKMSGLYEPVTKEVQEAADNNSLRIVTTPYGWHGFTYFSAQTARDTVQFFSTTFDFYDGQPLSAAASKLASENTGRRWMVKDVISAIAYIALMTMIIPLYDIVMRMPFFATMINEPLEPVESKKSPVFWITMLLMIGIPFFTYSSWVSWGKFLTTSAFFPIDKLSQIAFWSICMTVILLAILIVKYFVYDKKKFNLTFKQIYGLNLGWKNAGKSILLALLMFAIVNVIVTVYFNLFAAAHMKLTIGGAVLYSSLSKTQYHSWALYSIYFLPFYLFNSMLVCSSRFKDMGKNANTWLVAVINGFGMFLLSFFQLFIGLGRTGATFFKVAPGGTALIYCLSVLAVNLFVSAIFTRKLYEKTGSAIPGAILNTAIMTIPAIQLSANYMFL